MYINIERSGFSHYQKNLPMAIPNGGRAADKMTFLKLLGRISCFCSSFMVMYFLMFNCQTSLGLESTFLHNSTESPCILLTSFRYFVAKAWLHVFLKNLHAERNFVSICVSVQVCHNLWSNTLASIWLPPTTSSGKILPISSLTKPKYGFWMTESFSTPGSFWPNWMPFQRINLELS